MKGWDKLAQQSKEMYEKNYFLDGETYVQWLDRVTSICTGSHKTRMMEYIGNYWFHPSTPISSNTGTDRGMLISCFTNSVEDSKDGIFGNFEENFRLGAGGGGIGTDYSAIREIGSKVGIKGESGGVIPFIKVADSATLAISQGGLRRASQAIYLDISHPEVLEFLEIRKPNGDSNRKCLNIHQGIKLSDKFMEAVANRSSWELVSPKTKEIVDVVDAYDLYCKILELRHQTGEPFIMYTDTINKGLPTQYIEKGYKVETSNLCSEITLHTSPTKTGVCCLGSINLAYWDEIYPEYGTVISDCIEYLDLVLQDFIDKSEGVKGFEKARAAAIEERSLGLGVMGYHTYLQAKSVPFEGALATGITHKIFKCIKEVSSRYNSRNWNVTAIAPTASISTLCNCTSQGIDPILSNAYSHKTRMGTTIVKNILLEKRLQDFNHNTEEVWKSIVDNSGSVQHLDFLPEWDKGVFKTAYEIDQHWVVELAAIRTPYIDQSQSVNLFFAGDCSRKYLMSVHDRAYKKGLKSLYYCRSTSVGSASLKVVEREVIEECLSCQ